MTEGLLHVTPPERRGGGAAASAESPPSLAHSCCGMELKDVDWGAQNRLRPTFVRKTTERGKVQLRETGFPSCESRDRK